MADSTSTDSKPLTKEEKLLRLQHEFEDSQKFWKKQQDQAKQDGNHLVAIACADKADKYRDLVRILYVLNEKPL